MEKATIDTEHIAKLAYLEFNEIEMSHIQKDMEEMIGMVSSLPNTCNTPSIVNPVQMRADEIRENTVNPEEILLSAPQIYDGCIAVPKTVE